MTSESTRYKSVFLESNGKEYQSLCFCVQFERVCASRIPESDLTTQSKVVFQGRFAENLATAQTKQGQHDKRNLDPNVKCFSSHEEWHWGLCGEWSLGRGPTRRVQGWGHYLHLHSTQSAGRRGGGAGRDPEGCRTYQHTATAICKSSTTGRVFMLSLK